MGTTSMVSTGVSATRPCVWPGALTSSGTPAIWPTFSGTAARSAPAGDEGGAVVGRDDDQAGVEGPERLQPVDDLPEHAVGVSDLGEVLPVAVGREGRVARPDPPRVRVGARVRPGRRAGAPTASAASSGGRSSASGLPRARGSRRSRRRGPRRRRRRRPAACRRRPVRAPAPAPGWGLAGRSHSARRSRDRSREDVQRPHAHREHPAQRVGGRGAGPLRARRARAEVGVHAGRRRAGRCPPAAGRGCRDDRRRRAALRVGAPAGDDRRQRVGRVVGDGLRLPVPRAVPARRAKFG